jgi:hypothetical protein
MAGSSRLKAKNLEAFGTARLAQLLLTLSEGDLQGLAEGLFDRCDDSDAVVRDFFHQSSAALGQVALMAAGDAKALADQVHTATMTPRH